MPNTQSTAATLEILSYNVQHRLPQTLDTTTIFHNFETTVTTTQRRNPFVTRTNPKLQGTIIKQNLATAAA